MAVEWSAQAASLELERLKAETERERLERQRHQSQRLESLGQLAGGVAHDFNNLLSVILNYSAFIAEALSADGWDGDRRDHARDDIEQIRRAADRATALTHQLLAFARREVIRPKVIDLNHVVSEVRQLLRRTIGEHISLMTNLDPAAGMILADPGQIEQVLVNLTVNARDAMPAGGTITIDTEDVNITPQQARRRRIEPGHYVRLRVTDTGAGMPRDVIDRAFEPFYTTKPKGQGTGLGLATVYGIITQAGGNIWITSATGHGTTIIALFPVTASRPEPAEPAPSGHVTGKGKTILVVEDEDALREVVRRILARHDYTVIVAANGPQALTLAKDIPEIHLLLTDVIMPEMAGNDLAERIQALRPATKVLYMSGYAQPILTCQGILDPTVTLVAKPFTENELLADVRTMLGTHAVPA